jgi:hypothetical protein
MDENSLHTEDNNKDKRVLSNCSNTGKDITMQNERPASSAALKDELGEKALRKDTSSNVLSTDINSNGVVEVDRDVVHDKRPLTEVEQTVQDLVTQVDNSVANKKGQQKNTQEYIKLDSSLSLAKGLQDSRSCKDNSSKGVDETTAENDDRVQTKIDTDVLSDVLGIIEDVLVRVDKNVIRPGKSTMYGELNMSQECDDNARSDYQHGYKRTFSDVVLDDKRNAEPTIQATKDSLYIMSLVEAELEAVGHELEEKYDSKEKPKLVDYDGDSSESSDEESSDSSSDSDSTSSDESFTKERYMYSEKTEISSKLCRCIIQCK